MNIHVEEFKLKVNGKEHTFVLNMLSAIKTEEKYGNFAEIFNGLLTGDKFYSNAFKLLSCSCKEKDWSLEEIAEAFSINFEVLKQIDNIVQAMYTKFEAFKDPEENKNTEKNEETSQVSNMK